MVRSIARLFRYALLMQTKVGPSVRRLLRAWTAGIAIIGLACTAEAPERPSLVLLTVDRLAADRLDCFGGAPGAGARLCGLAEQGTLFGWAVTPSADEASAAASVLTGLAPDAHGVDAHGPGFLAEAHETLAESLLRVGYATGAFVESPRLNRSRRLDQGFLLYEDRPGATRRESDRAASPLQNGIEDWIAEAGRPFFLWIHLRGASDLTDLESLVDRLARSLPPDEPLPGILFAALAGESRDPRPRARPEPDAASAGADRSGQSVQASEAAEAKGSEAPRIELRVHRVPLVWRPPTGSRPSDPQTSFRLASLLDVEPTLRASAGLSPRLEAPHPKSPPPQAPLAGRRRPETRPAEAFRAGAGGSRAAIRRGHDLGRRIEGSDESAAPARIGAPTERFLLLEGPSGVGRTEIGLASEHHLYVRLLREPERRGRPASAAELPALSPRYVRIEPADRHDMASIPEAALAPSPWRTDVLSATSPVPRLEFHLARLLAERDGHVGPR
ncbi:MAG TPA: hypothetical protein VKA74_01285 [Myxococcota bacterium]|nr:hypothetical protein [Myxococcota bacterium]